MTEKTQFLQQLATLLDAGFSVQQSLLMAGRNCRASFQQRLQQANRQVDQGADLASALATHPALFDTWTLTLLQIAEQSGALATMCQRLAVAADRRRRHQPLYFSISSSTIAIVLGLLIFLMLMLRAANNFLTQSLVGLLGAFLLALMFALANQQPRFPLRSEKLQHTLSQLPIVGQMIQARSMLDFAELALPLGCGLSPLAAVELLHQHVADLSLKASLKAALYPLQTGNPLSDSLRGELPTMALQMLRTGEETGNLDDRLLQMSEYYSDELEQALRTCQGILKPVSILVIGSVVALLGMQMLTALSNALPQ